MLILFIFLCSFCRQDNPYANSKNEVIKETMAPMKYPQLLNMDYVMGKFDPSVREDFAEVDISHADRKGMYLHRDSYDAFQKMYEAAFEDGVKLIIRSATRNFDYQKGIWTRKWEGRDILEDGVKASDLVDGKSRALKILRYSSMPGSSRHHWGSDMDLNAFTNEYFDKGEGKKIYDWLRANAASFGFCQPYTSKESGRTGYEEERWHWSYLPISAELTNWSASHFRNEFIEGFPGSEAAIAIDILNNYILGVNSECILK